MQPASTFHDRRLLPGVTPEVVCSSFPAACFFKYRELKSLVIRRTLVIGNKRGHVGIVMAGISWIRELFSLQNLISYDRSRPPGKPNPISLKSEAFALCTKSKCLSTITYSTSHMKEIGKQKQIFQLNFAYLRNNGF